MKISLPLLGLILLIFTGCDKSLTDISAPIKLSFEVVGDTNFIAKEEILDGNTNADFRDNRSKIKDLTINKIQYKIERVGAGSGDSLINGIFEFKNPAGVFEPLAALNNKKFPPLNVPLDLELNQNTLDKMKAAFKSDPYRGTVRFSARLDKKPVDFKISITVYVVVSV